MGDSFSKLKRRMIIGRVGSVLVCLCGIAIVLYLLLQMLLWVGRPGQRAGTEGGNLGIDEKYEMFITNEISEALDGILAVKKQYWISDNELVAPKPNPECYGRTDDPKSLQWLLDAAEELLDGQELYFNTDIEIMPGSMVHYYLDDTILAITWKQGMDYGAYTFSEVKIAHPSQFRRFVANGEFGSDKLFLTTEMARSVNAVVASSGDYYRYRHAGILVYDGVARRVDNWLMDTCYIDRQGDMHFTKVREPMTLEEAQTYVDENDISFSLAFGPILVENGQRHSFVGYRFGEIDDEFVRAALCQMGKLHYLVMAVNQEGRYNLVPDMYRFANNVAKTGCIHAYALDGGQTATIVMENELINRVMYGSQRRISDIIYFATAIPNGG